MKDSSRIDALKALDDLYYTCNVVEIEYLLGKKVSRGVVIAGKGEAAFFVDSRYRSGCNDLKSVTVHTDKLEEQKKFIASHFPDVVLFDSNALNLTQYGKLKEIVPEKAILEEKTPVAEMRMIKDAEEIKLIRESAKLNRAAYDHLISQLRVGMSESDAAWIFEKFAREHGAEAMGFGPTVAFGKGSSIPHYDTAHVRLKPGMPVLIDVGVQKDRYMSDMTRSFIFKGEDQKYEKMHALVAAAAKEAIDMAKPGLPIYKLDETIRNRFQEAHVEEAFKHATGHGLGLELHEPPRIHHTLDKKMELQEDMVITIEPGLYFDDQWGIRHEDTIVITNKGSENLYESRNRTR